MEVGKELVKWEALFCDYGVGSVVVRGVVCRKNVQHRRMTSRFKNPRLLLLGGALEYQRVTNQLSSLETLLQQVHIFLTLFCPFCTISIWVFFWTIESSSRALFFTLQWLGSQEKDHLSMAVARIEAHHPNILLVEKTVSRFAQDRLLAREISVVLNVKRPLLERIAQCTGAQVSSYFLQNCPLRYFWRHSLTFA